MRIIWFILFLSIWTTVCVAKVRTLSICIGEYPSESGWNALGANNDACLIKGLFHEATVISNENATNKNILRELATLSKTALRGDTVIVHFSGHGQQILSGTSAEEVDWVDEAIVPYDAAKRKSATYNGQSHITDDIFGEYIARIRKAAGSDGLVIAVVDACHSDSMDKDADGSTDIYRGTDEIFGAEALPPDSIAKLRDMYDSPDESPVLTSPELSNAVFISACRTHQRNYEIKVGDSSYGSLTYYFCKAYDKNGISDLNRFLSDLYAEMTSDKIMKFHGQEPVIRNTLGWEAPKTRPHEPTDKHSPVQDDDSNLYYWLYIIVLVVVSTLILMLCRKKKK